MDKHMVTFFKDLAPKTKTSPERDRIVTTMGKIEELRLLSKKGVCEWNRQQAPVQIP